MSDKFSHMNSDIIYISHGGGPMPLMGDESHAKMIEFLTDLPTKLRTPDEILVISAHWEEDTPTVYGSEMQALLYDYYGFPPETYEIEYPTKRSPDLEAFLKDTFAQSGKTLSADTQRGLDHGVFIPLKIMYPDGGIPVTQLSLLSDLDSLSHLEMGKALRPLRKRNVLIIGSGFSFHNMRHFSMKTPGDNDERNNEFQDWLIRTCTTKEEVSLYQDLEKWTEAPQARYCHPREEHLLPLHVCAGIAGSPATAIFDDYIAGKRSVAFQW